MIGVALFIIAAALGATVRAVAGQYLNTEQFPYGTFAVNVTSSLVLGALTQAGDQWQAVIGVGALGALSTWSGVASEVAGLARARQAPMAFLYLVAMSTTGILAAWIGIKLAG